MSETLKLIGALGKKGLVERLTDEEREFGVSNFQLLIGLVKNRVYERVLGIGDDFIPDVSLYNAVGAIYPLVDNNQRDMALKVFLDQFDLINYLSVNTNHTPYIREPLLLADICRGNNYWPGLKDEERLWKNRSFEEFKEDVILENGLFDPNMVKSDFLVAYAVMRSDFTNFGEEYVQIANPTFLDRVLLAIVMKRFSNTSIDVNDLEQKKLRLLGILPKSVHERLEYMINEITH